MASPVVPIALHHCGIRARHPTGDDKLEVPKHYEPGAEFLRLSADIDTEGNGRPLWLSPRARAAVEAVAPARGRIFSGF